MYAVACPWHSLRSEKFTTAARWHFGNPSSKVTPSSSWQNLHGGPLDGAPAINNFTPIFQSWIRRQIRRKRNTWPNSGLSATPSGQGKFVRGHHLSATRRVIGSGILAGIKPSNRVWYSNKDERRSGWPTMKEEGVVQGRDGEGNTGVRKKSQNS